MFALPHLGRKRKAADVPSPPEPLCAAVRQGVTPSRHTSMPADSASGQSAAPKTADSPHCGLAELDAVTGEPSVQPRVLSRAYLPAPCRIPLPALLGSSPGLSGGGAVTVGLGAAEAWSPPRTGSAVRSELGLRGCASRDGACAALAQFLPTRAQVDSDAGAMAPVSNSPAGASHPAGNFCVLSAL